MRYHAEELCYERVKIFEKEAFFTCDRVQRDSKQYREIYIGAINIDE